MTPRGPGRRTAALATLAGVCLLWPCGRAVAAARGNEAFPYVREVHLPEGVELPRVMRVALDAGLVAEAGPDGGGLRLVDDRGISVPFRVVVEDGKPMERSRTLRVRSLARPQENRLAVLLEVEGDGRVPHNELEVELGSAPFFCRAMLESSDDGQAWIPLPLLEEETLQSVAGPGSSRLRYEESSDPLLRLQLDCHEREEAAAFRSRLVWSWPARLLRYPAQVEREAAAGSRPADLLTATLEPGVVPVHRLSVRSRRAFRRASELRARSDARERWRVVASPTFEARAGDAAAAVTVGEVWAGEVQLALWRGGGPALPAPALEVRGWARSILFRAEPGRAYRLYSGGDPAPPGYPLPPDLTEARPDRPQARLAARSPNRSFAPEEPRPWVDMPAWALGVILVVAAAGVGYFLFRQMRI